MNLRHWTVTVTVPCKGCGVHRISFNFDDEPAGMTLIRICNHCVEHTGARLTANGDVIAVCNNGQPIYQNEVEYVYRKEVFHRRRP